MKRVHTQFGSHPEIKACITMAGPQAEDQVPPEVIALLNKKGIKTVAVLFDHGLGMRIEIFNPMQD